MFQMSKEAYYVMSPPSAKVVMFNWGHWGKLYINSIVAINALQEDLLGPLWGSSKDIEAKYGRGVVVYKGIKVGAYIDGRMELLGDGAKLQKRFDALLSE